MALIVRCTVFAFILLAGCARVGVTTIYPYEVPAKDGSCRLDMYSDEAEITRPHRVLCVLDSVTGSMFLNRRKGADAIDYARSEACKCGADALLIVRVVGTQTPAFSYGHGEATLKAIGYTDAQP